MYLEWKYYKFWIEIKLLQASNGNRVANMTQRENEEHDNSKMLDFVFDFSIVFLF